jgi:hypothetical protein
MSGKGRRLHGAHAPVIFARVLTNAVGRSLSYTEKPDNPQSTRKIILLDMVSSVGLVKGSVFEVGTMIYLDNGRPRAYSLQVQHATHPCACHTNRGETHTSLIPEFFTDVFSSP